MKSIQWEHSNLLDVSLLSVEDINIIMKLACYFFAHNRTEQKHHLLLKNKNIILFFTENSTRTRLSFEIAAQRLGATTHYMQKAGSSIQKGESLKDTMLTLMAMRPDAFVIRSEYSGGAQYLASYSNVPVMNAGDGWHAHPTQALLDLFTLAKAWNTSYEGKTVTIVGDIKHSRVARSDIQIFQKMGIRVRLCSPATLSLFPETFSGVECYTDICKAVEGVDAVIALRLQKERQSQGLIAQEYYGNYGITERVLSYAKPDALLLHPGPVNVNIDIAPELIDGRRGSKIVEQVEAGVAVRMALLYLFCHSSPSLLSDDVCKE